MLRSTCVSGSVSKLGIFTCLLGRSLELAIDLKDRLKIIHIEASQIVEYKQVESKENKIESHYVSCGFMSETTHYLIKQIWKL